ncbi:tRNA (guanosine(46)-N7)-methyltransferase TrmB [Maricaulis sp.]|uniref:tRNA (guanosine(46)-N7)-methyltransferase TrmB n=1 Tax=Maricaulis sp. TaxID=1486257 RepID=UPI003A92D5C9
MTDQLNASGDFRLFGRAKGKPLSARQQALIDTLLPALDLPAEGEVVPARLLPGQQGHVLEIGFGSGEHLVAQAAAHPDNLYIGIEPFLNGVAKALAGVDEGGLTNVRLHRGDARDALPRFADASIDRIFLLFPDPWHKKRHAKRRFIQQSTRDEFARILKSGGQLRIATDVKSYADHVMAEFAGDDRFDWTARQADDWRLAPADHVRTRYETKNLGDCAPVFMDFVCRGGDALPSAAKASI